MAHAPIRIAVIILGHKDGPEWPGQSQRHNEVDDARESPSVDHLQILFHIDPTVDRQGDILVRVRIREILSNPALDPRARSDHWQ